MVDPMLVDGWLEILKKFETVITILWIILCDTFHLTGRKGSSGIKNTVLLYMKFFMNLGVNFFIR